MRTAVNICVVLTCVIALANENSPAPISTAVDVRNEDLLVLAACDELDLHTGDYSGRRYSSLAEINTTNNGRVAQAEVGVPCATLKPPQVTPVVVNGVMFITASNTHSLSTQGLGV